MRHTAALTTSCPVYVPTNKLCQSHCHKKPDPLDLQLPLQLHHDARSVPFHSSSSEKCIDELLLRDQPLPLMISRVYKDAYFLPFNKMQTNRKPFLVILALNNIVAKAKAQILLSSLSTPQQPLQETHTRTYILRVFSREQTLSRGGLSRLHRVHDSYIAVLRCLHHPPPRQQFVDGLCLLQGDERRCYVRIHAMHVCSASSPSISASYSTATLQTCNLPCSSASRLNQSSPTQQEREINA